MALTNGQKRALHAAARQAGVDEDQRRIIQRNVGGFYSAADKTASRQGFIAVMAFYERRCGGALEGNTAGYWQAENDKANPTDGLVFACRKIAGRLGLSNGQLDAFLAGRHMSCGACQSLEGAPAYWLRKLLEGLKAIEGRGARRATA